MRKVICWLISTALLLICSESVLAELGDSLKIPKGERQSSYVLMSKDNQLLQDDMTSNPALFWILEGEALWKQSEKNRPACIGCHQDISKMKGVATSYPKLLNKQLVTLEDRVNLCRSRQGLPVYAYESKELLSLTSFIAYQSRDQKIHLNLSPELKEQAQKGEALFNFRMGQINLSCANCHEERSGLSLGGVIIPQGHPTAYPIYRIEWQSVGSLQRRLRNCMIGLRAEPFAFGSEELKQLELFLKVRADGMDFEAPGVRP